MVFIVLVEARQIVVLLGWVRTPLYTQKYGRLPEWLTEQFAKLSSVKWRVSSNLTSSARNAFVVQLAEAAVLETAQCGFESHRKYNLKNIVMGMFSEANAKGNAERLERIILDAIHNPYWENERDIIYDFVRKHIVPLYYDECAET